MRKKSKNMFCVIVAGRKKSRRHVFCFRSKAEAKREAAAARRRGFDAKMKKV